MDNYDQPYVGDVSTSLTLLQRAVQNDQDAWRRIQELYVPFVYKWCRIKRVRPSDIPDVGQEVFLAIANGLGNFDRSKDGQTFRGWLRIITRNKIADHFRQKGAVLEAKGGSTAQQFMSEAVFQNEVVDEETTTKAELELLWNQACQLILTEFPEWYTEVFIRLVVHEEKAADIAAELGKRTAAIFNIKSKVRRRILKEFGDLLE